jgi:UDP-N-acetylglucosamine diphosphorylase/glucosamine-1-phosphate N-acetyltransferase
MNLILFDDHRHTTLKPLTYTRPVGDLRIGILRISEKWEKRMNTSASFLTMPYLREKFPAVIAEQNLLVNGGLLPDADLIDAISQLQPKEALVDEQGELMALIVPGDTLSPISPNQYRELLQTLGKSMRHVVYNRHFDVLNHCPDIFALNEIELERDFDLLTTGRQSADLSAHNQIFGSRFFAEEGAQARGAVFNTESGPVYLGKNSEVMEGSLVRGGLALCENATLKMGAKIYGATTIGPHSKVGGEVNNCVIQGFSNKGHDGFIGNSVIGEWCNLGADTNTSNLKNNYGEVKIWNFQTETLQNSGRQFVGLMMGDHSKCGINTMFNTGTTVGVFANVFGSGFPPKFIPSFAWGGDQHFETYNLNKAFEVAASVMGRRQVELTAEDRLILTAIFETSEKFRK